MLYACIFKRTMGRSFTRLFANTPYTVERVTYCYIRKSRVRILKQSRIYIRDVYVYYAYISSIVLLINKTFNYNL